MRRIAAILGLAALALAGLLAGIFLPPGEGSTTAAAATSRVTVSASEFKFAFSKRSVPTGTVIFTVVNKGKISHDFKIANKKTRVLQPGQSQPLRVKFAKKGRFAFICTLPGHAGAGMKGKYAVGTAPVVSPPGTTTQPPTTTTTTPPPTGPIGPGNTTVQVGMFEYGFNLSQSTVPSGQVTFVIANNGSEVHNFAIPGVKAGEWLSPGRSETWTVGLPAKTYVLVCDVPFHVDRGMTGSLTVTP